MEGLRGAPELLLLVLLSLAGGSLSGPAIRTVPVPEGRSVSLICDESEPISFHEPVLWSVTPRGGVGHTVVSRLEGGSLVKGADDPQNRFSLLDDSSLQIWSVKPGDSGLYSCNRQPVADLQVTTVIISVPEGQYLILNCSDPPPAQGTSVQWTYRRDREGDTQATDVTRKIPNTEQKKYHVYSSGSLYIHDVSLDDSGLYYCNSQAVAELEVLGGTGETGDTGTPARKTSPGKHAADRAGEGGRDTGQAIRTVTVPEGGSVTLICAVRKPVSSHEPVQWSVTLRDGVGHTVLSRLKDGSLVKGADDPQNRFSLLDDSSLLIWSVKPGDSGLYSCNRQPVVDLQVTKGGTSPTPGAETSSGKPAPGGGGKGGDDTGGTSPTPGAETSSGKPAPGGGGKGGDDTGSSLWERGKVVIPVLLGLCALALLTGAALFWCRRKRGPGTGSWDKGVSLQRASPSAPGTETNQSAAGQGEGEVHYASLGHQGKRDPRPRAQDADSSVVYSSVARGV